MRQHRPDGYTLIELLVVIAILALIAAIAMPVASRAVEAATFRADARRLAGELEALQQRAMDQQETITIAAATNGAAPSVSSGDKFALSNSEKLSLASDTQAISFFADGTSSGGTLNIVNGPRAIAVKVAWLTGAVTVGTDADAR